jgi:ligand-binding sensor domain-containing protein
LSKNLGDQPITSIAFDPFTGDLFASTDYGVLMLSSGGTDWSPAAANLPAVAVYGLTIDADARLLYAATHGRGIWRLKLEDSDDVMTGGQHD